jgi:hypothetical protein
LLAAFATAAVALACLPVAAGAQTQRRTDLRL